MEVTSVQVSLKNTLIPHKECTQVMLRELSCGEDFVGALVCIRLQECAVDGFQSNQNRRNNRKKLQANFFEYLINETRAMMKCDKNTLQLSLKVDENMREIRTFNLNLMNNQHQYEILEKLLFFRTSPDDCCLDMPPISLNITIPYLTRKQLCLIRPFPQLKHVEFRSIDNLKESVLAHFFNFNQQIERVEINDCAGMPTHFLVIFAEFTKNLTHLRVRNFDFMKNQPDYHEIFEDLQRTYYLEALAHLPKLKFLDLEDTSKFSMDAVINVLADGKAPIEYLALSPGNSYRYSEKMQTLPTLKYLQLKGIKGTQMLDDLIATQCNLEKIHLKWHTSEKRLLQMATTFLTHMVERGIRKDLCELTFYVTHKKGGYISRNTYDSILKLARDAVENKIRIVMHKRRIKVPADVIKKNRDVIDIAYK